MKTRLISTLVLASALSAVSRAQSVLTNSIVEIDVTSGQVASVTVTAGGQNYTAAPTVTLVGGGGNPAATATAQVVAGAVTEVDIVTAGANYLAPPVVEFSGGGTNPAPSGATATASLALLSPAAVAPFQNEVSGPAGDGIIIWSEALGTEPASGFVYDITVNGHSIGATTPEQPAGTPAGGGFVPPLPGVYTIVSTTQDGNGNSATSPAIRYFATGTAIVSEEAGGTPGLTTPGTLVPVGSSVILQAVSTPADGFISRIDFYTDWNGTSGTLIGSTTNSPYSLIYTPAGPVGTQHVVKAIAYDNLGNAVTASASMDQVVYTMTTPNPSSLPSCVIVTPASGSLVEIPDYAANAQAAIPVIVTAGAAVGAQIQRVELYINGQLFATDTAYPYTFNWQPTVTGTYDVTALAYDNLGNVVASTTSTSPTQTPSPTTVSIEAAPAVAITTPGDGATLNGGVLTSITAVATDTNFDSQNKPVSISNVEFFQDGRYLGVATLPTGNNYTVSYTPIQNVVNGVTTDSQLVAIATDTLGYTATSPTVTVNVTAGGSGGGQVIGTPPTVNLVTPAAGSNLVVNVPATLTASGNAPNGYLAQVSFLVDGNVFQTVKTYPYTVSWTPVNPGTYQIGVQVIDNKGDQVSTAPVTVTVTTPPSPSVSITGPSSGTIITAGTPVSITATASSPAGTITQVQFFENGQSIGTATSAPYTESFTPLSSGLYTFTAVATDNSNQTTMSNPVETEAFPASSGVGSVTDFGQYLGLGANDMGNFAFMSVNGTNGVFIGHSTGSGKPTLYFSSGIPVSSLGSFNTSKLSGSASPTGATGNLLPGGEQFIGSSTQPAGYAVASGYLTGTIQGSAGSAVTTIIGTDGHVMMYISSGSYADVADTFVDPSGNFSATTSEGNMISGTADPATGFLTATLSGPSGGTILAALSSGGTFSDGVLRNLSTRGSVGTAGNAMIAGFVVSGSSPKQLLIRAIGPTLSTFNISGSVQATELQVFSGSSLIASNTGWGSTNANAAVVASAEMSAGAFSLPAGSADSALVGTFAPGAYTALVSPAGSASPGVGLVEVWDLDPYVPFTTKKLVNVSTRGSVGTGNNVLIAGFVVNGQSPKLLLIRGAGPGLVTTGGITDALATPRLQLYNSAGQEVREDYAWQSGNDSAMVTSAEKASGAFTFANASADSAILIVLPPGSYTAELSGAGGSTGTGLVEVYEVP
ncbi:MAG TPA: Ig-like domain-containing protein [Opitutaceae bacterium]|jgi:hypothetical protein